MIAKRLNVLTNDGDSLCRDKIDEKLKTVNGDTRDYKIFQVPTNEKRQQDLPLKDEEPETSLTRRMKFLSESNGID